MAKTISDEAIIASLLCNGTKRDAAAALGVSERTLFDRMNDSEFKVAYKAAKSDLVRQAVVNLNTHISEAVDTITGIMNDKEAAPSIRLQAAQMILNHSCKYSERLDSCEQSVASQITSNEFDDEFEILRNR